MNAATEIADEVAGWFSKMHPHIRMNMEEWSCLREMIEREVQGHFGSSRVSASDLLKD